ncbi:MAG: aldo/keto reductase [Clostridiales bacterium]|jgi:diketogulonate reductase-like aldo/keto reductase|nr:aldo/keto reductase [Clostridiales bacterium]
MIRTISANGLTLPVLGQGGWHIGDSAQKARNEIAALRLGIELGMTLIDTAEMYGEGKSEQIIGKALAGLNRTDYQLVSKVYPHNAGRRNIFASCDASLKRLKTDYLDLYLLHWRGSVPLEETVECMENLVQAGKIKRWGVSNFDTSDMEELWAIPSGRNCAVDQVLYNLGSRGIEYDLISWLAAREVAVMAYCPLAQAGTLRRMSYDFKRDPVLAAISTKYNISVTQLMLAFVLRRDNVIAIPKSGSITHTRENAEALSLSIAEEDWREIDKVYLPPSAKMILDME